MAALLRFRKFKALSGTATIMGIMLHDKKENFHLYSYSRINVVEMRALRNIAEVTPTDIF